MPQNFGKRVGIHFYENVLSEKNAFKRHVSIKIDIDAYFSSFYIFWDFSKDRLEVDTLKDDLYEDFHRANKNGCQSFDLIDAPRQYVTMYLMREIFDASLHFLGDLKNNSNVKAVWHKKNRGVVRIWRAWVQISS